MSQQSSCHNKPLICISFGCATHISAVLLGTLLLVADKLHAWNFVPNGFFLYLKHLITYHRVNFSLRYSIKSFTWVENTSCKTLSNASFHPPRATIILIYLFIFLGPHLRHGLKWSYSCQPTPQPQQRQMRASRATYTTALGNARSLTHGARPGIELATSWFLVRFAPAVPWELLIIHFYIGI